MRQRRLLNEINVVPYIDVMLVLLVIFMVTAPMIQTGSVDLPSVGKSSQPPVAPLEVIIKADGSLSLRDRARGSAEQVVTPAELPERLKQAQAASPAAADQGRFIVQVGAFADADKVREVRERLERSGLKTYTQVVDTKDGKRTRVRLGPFDSRAEADKAVGRVKGAGLSASVLTL